MSQSTGIEAAIEILAKMEKELDDLKEYGEEARRRLLALAREEAGRVKELLIEEANMRASEEIQEAEKKAEEEARKRILEGEERSKVLSQKIEKAFGKAVDQTVSAILGE